MEKIEAHVSKYKKKQVDNLIELICGSPIVGIVNMENMPAPQLQGMRAQMRGNVNLVMSKKRLMRLALEQAKNEKKGIEVLESALKGMPAFLFTKENPFKLYRLLQKSKSKAPAKAGQTAPGNITVPKGATSFAPGPIIGELAGIGIKTSVEGGKLAIKEDSTVVKEGEIIKPKVAELLTRLGIEPMEIGLELIAVYEDGVIYKKDVLSIDETKFMNDLNNAARWSINLAVEACYFTKETIDLMVPKAFLEAKALVLEANIMCDLIAEELVQKAEMQMLSLKEEADITEAAPEERYGAELPEKEAKAEESIVQEAPTESAEPVPEIAEAAQQEPKIEIVEEEPKVAEEFSQQEPEIEAVEETPKYLEEKEAAEKEVEHIKELKEEIKEELVEVEEEIKEIESEPVPEIKNIEHVEKEIKKIEDDIQEVRKATSIASMPKRPVDQSTKEQAMEAERLYEELKKKGTLRGMGKKEKTFKIQEELTPAEIIRRHQEKMKKLKKDNAHN